MDKKRVLMLSLGVGSIFGNDQGKLTLEEKRGRLARKEFSYKKATYCMEGESDPLTTEFIAEPLVKSFRPDEIFIIGTSKSSWASFYSKFGDGNLAVIEELFQMEERDGIGVRGGELKRRAQIVESHYRNGITGGIFGKALIHVIMLCYGVNDDELAENYRLLRSIDEAFDRENSYEIAFDITHSFRSLPLYNLVVLNYLKSVSQIDLEISHVYYGNFEIAGENNEKSPIVDLKELMQMLNLFSGINEFKNTGNCVSLIQHIPDEENELKEALERFDWATQLNLFDQVMASLGALITLSDDCGRQDKITDLRRMVADVIRVKFFNAGGEGGVLADYIRETLIKEFPAPALRRKAANSTANPCASAGGTEETLINQCFLRKMPVKELQYLLCRWYLQQNRYGQAVVTALEAMRSYLVEMYLRSKGIDVVYENVMNENYRRESVDKLKAACMRIGESCATEYGDAGDLLCELDKARAEATKIRNRFAHNLVDGAASDNRSDGYYKSKEAICNFIEKLGELRNMLAAHPEKVEKIYHRKSELPKARAERGGMMSRIVVPCNNAAVSYNSYRLSNNEKEYIVYSMPEKILEYMEIKSRNPKGLAGSSLFLAEYVADLGIEQNKIQIIFIGFELRRVMNYAVPLQNRGIQCFYAKKNKTGEKLLPVPKLIFDVDWAKYRKWEMSDEEQELMALDVQMQD